MSAKHEIASLNTLNTQSSPERTFTMEKYNKRLEELREQMASRNRLERILKDLKAQRQELSDKVYELENEKLKEQADVEKLEGRSLAALYYYLTGQKEERLDKEKQEAYAARVKYDAALSELNAVEADIQNTENNLRAAQRSEQEYQKVLQEKAAFMKESGNSNASQILDFENQLAQLENQLTELREAISAGDSALATIRRILSSLENAEGWATWDMLGGGLIADACKHSSLDEAQSLVENLQIQLRRFKTELADVSVQADIQISIDGFLRFADFFFDGLLADWTVMDKIEQSKQQVIDTNNQLANVLNQLNSMLTSTEQEKKTTQNRMDHFIYEH